MAASPGPDRSWLAAAWSWRIRWAKWSRFRRKMAKWSPNGDVGQAVFIPPIVANGMIYFVTDDARLVVLR